jgi:hypothetical protein
MIAQSSTDQVIGPVIVAERIGIDAGPADQAVGRLQSGEATQRGWLRIEPPVSEPRAPNINLPRRPHPNRWTIREMLAVPRTRAGGQGRSKESAVRELCAELAAIAPA